MKLQTCASGMLTVTRDERGNYKGKRADEFNLLIGKIIPFSKKPNHDGRALSTDHYT